MKDKMGVGHLINHAKNINRNCEVKNREALDKSIYAYNSGDYDSFRSDFVRGIKGVSEQKKGEIADTILGHHKKNWFVTLALGGNYDGGDVAPRFSHLRSGNSGNLEETVNANTFEDIGTSFREFARSLYKGFGVVVMGLKEVNGVDYDSRLGWIMRNQPRDPIRAILRDASKPLLRPVAAYFHSGIESALDEATEKYGNGLLFAAIDIVKGTELSPDDVKFLNAVYSALYAVDQREAETLKRQLKEEPVVKALQGKYGSSAMYSPSGDVLVGKLDEDLGKQLGLIKAQAQSNGLKRLIGKVPYGIGRYLTLSSIDSALKDTGTQHYATQEAVSPVYA